GQHLPRTPTSGRQPLRLASPARISGYHGIAPGVALGLEFPKQLEGRPTASIPAREEIVFIGREQTPPIRTAVLLPGTRRRVQIAKDGALAEPHLPGNGRDRPALAMQNPYLVIERLPTCRPLGGPLLHRLGWSLRGHWESARAVEPDRWRAQGRIDGVQDLVMGGKDLIQGFPEILQ